MELWPAIAIHDRGCVRLRRGNFLGETSFSDPVVLANKYMESGADRLHVIDLDAALTGEAENRDIVIKLARSSGLFVQHAGGVRDEEAAEALLESGVARIVVSTAALDRELLERLVSRWPGRIVVGLDFRKERGADGAVRRHLAFYGWTERSQLTLEDGIERLADLPVAGVVVTDISRVGTCVGPDIATYGEMLSTTGLHVVASGGVGDVGDILRLRRLGSPARRLDGVVIGSALWSGRMSLGEARKMSLATAYR